MPIASLWPLPPPSVPSPASLARIGTGSRGEADYLAALQALLPRGRAWSRDPAATITGLLDGIAKSYAKADARQTNLLRDAFPVTTAELLPEWEATLGLPDPCLGQLPTLQQRQNQVAARITGRGGQSIGYLTSVAAQLGFSVAIKEFAPFRVGVSRVGDSLNGSQPPIGSKYFTVGSSSVGQELVTWAGGSPGFDWAFGLFINVIAEPTSFFRVGTGSVGEPLVSWAGSAALAQVKYFTVGSSAVGDHLVSASAPLLECEMRRILPAHVSPIFGYGA
jgi:uncharacterized protein YmfQ (DUF2313 family)